MADPSLFDAVRIPAEALIALDNRSYHFLIQPYHYIIRLVHVVAMAGFFGAIGLLDLRLLGWRAATPVRDIAGHALHWIYAAFALTCLTGVALFLFDPLKIGSRAYWAPKLIAILLALLNAALFHFVGYRRALTSEGAPTWSVRAAGAASLCLWTAAIVFSSLNVESAPKVLLR